MNQINLASPAVQLAQLHRSLEELAQVHQLMREQGTELAEKMLKLNVAENVQNSKIQGMVDVLA